MAKQRGDGTLVQVADGWRAVISVNGRRRWYTGRGRTPAEKKADANLWLRKARTSRDRGELADKQAPTLGAWLEHWLTDIAPERCEDSTLVRYRSMIATWVSGDVARVRLDRLTAADLRSVYRTMAAAGRAPSTIQQCHRILARALKVAEHERVIPRSPAALMDGPGGGSPEIVPPSRDDARAVLDAAALLERGRARWFVAFALGLRQGEALGLSWDDVDLDAGTLTVRYQLRRAVGAHGCPVKAGQPSCGRTPGRCPNRTAGGLYVKPPKSSASKRVIALPPQLVTALREHRVEQARDRLADGPRWLGWRTTPRGETGERDYPLVFCRRNGRPVEPSADNAAFKRLLASADVPEERVPGLASTRLHDSRHFAATVMLEMGVPLKVVSAILGHSSIAVTAKHYAHLVPELARDAAEKMGDALWDKQA